MDVQNQEPLANMTSNEDKVTYRDSTYEIVSKVAYLLGVPKRIFENEHEAPKLEVYEKLEQEKAARIIRHLCIIRTAIERNFKHINGKMVSEYRSILSMPEYIPPESIEQLRLDGVSFFKNSSKKLYQHIVEINRLISDRINNCKKYFPLWLNSVYTRSGQNSTPNSNATNLHSSQKRCCSFCISSSNASPTFQVQKSIFHQMTKPIQVTVILPLLLAISFSRNDDIHSSISGISNDLIGVIPTIGQ